MSKEDLKKQERIDLVEGQSTVPGNPSHNETGTYNQTSDDLREEVFQSADDTYPGMDETFVLGSRANSKSTGTEAEDLLIGQTIAGRLEILSKLGEGGMAVVYKARHVMLDRIVAVKLIKPGVMQEKAAMRFQQEAKAATALNHKNIATVREFGYDENGAYLVMDFVDGIPLSDFIKQESKLTPERTKKIISQICDGLEHAHNSGVVHRDLKPANIIIARNSSGEEFPKIVDFGIAKLVDEESQGNLTQTGEVFGTPNYMSPEQCLGKKADRRSDIYSLGCVIHECLTGAPPFVSDAALETLMKHVNVEFQPQKNKAPKYFMNAIQGCLEKNPEDRWPSADDLRQYLENPKGPAQKKYKKLEKHFSAKQVITLSVVSATVSAAIAVLVSIAPLTPYIQGLIAPKPWYRLAQEAQGQASLGPANYLTARTKFVKAIEEAKNSGATDLELESLYTNFARLLTNSGDDKTSKKYFALALQLNEKHGEDFARGSIHDWVAQIYLTEKNYPKAIEEARKAIEIKTRTIGENDRLTLLSFFRLGQAYRGNKAYEVAEAVDRKVVDITNKIYPNKDDILSSDAYEQLGNVLKDQGKNEEAIENYKLSLPILSKLFGNDHARTQKVLNKICRYLEKNNKSAEAAALRKAYTN